jgi:hypothetical protein
LSPFEQGRMLLSLVGKIHLSLTEMKVEWNRGNHRNVLMTPEWRLNYFRLFKGFHRQGILGLQDNRSVRIQ